MRRASVLFLALGMIALVATTSDARGARGDGRRHGMGIGPMWGDSSGVSPEVLASIQKAEAEFMEETLDLRTQLFNKTERFQLLMNDPETEDDEILKLHQEIHSLRGQLGQKHLQHMLQIRKDLPEGMRPGFLRGACREMGCGGGRGGCAMHGRGMGQGMSAKPGHGRGWGNEPMM